MDLTIITREVSLSQTQQEENTRRTTQPPYMTRRQIASSFCRYDPKRSKTADYTFVVFTPWLRFQPASPMGAMLHVNSTSRTVRDYKSVAYKLNLSKIRSK